MIITLILVFLIFLVLFYYNHNITEQFSCLAKHYYKTNLDEYEPIEEALCSGMTDEECNDYNAECIVSNIDPDKIKDENSEEFEDELEKLVKFCMKPTTDVFLDTKCLRRELKENRGRRGGLFTRRRSSHTKSLYKTIMKKCEIRSDNKKYTLDPKCVLFG